MLIDFHVHTFPDAIAARTMQKLCSITDIAPCTDATFVDTKRKMAEDGVTFFVLQPVATKASQVRTINELAAKQCGGGVISYGTLFPDEETFRADFAHLLSLGLPGVKMHPDYQGFFFEEQRLYPIYDALEQEGIPLLFHAGWDPLSPNLIHARPEGIAQVHKRFPKLTLIAAHLGGIPTCSHQAEALLGQDVYLDLGKTEGCPQELYETILHRHGAERILFGSDCPWGTPKDQLDKLRSTGLTEREERLICWENAKRLLGAAYERALR